MMNLPTASDLISSNSKHMYVIIAYLLYTDRIQNNNMHEIHSHAQVGDKISHFRRTGLLLCK